jgi:hypothetical protein
LNRTITGAAAGLTALFGVAAMVPALTAVMTAAMTTASRADPVAYNPNPATAAEARVQIAYLRDQLAALPARFAGAAQALLAASPVRHPALREGEKSCFSLINSVSFGFDYGPGSIRTPMMRIIEVPARALSPDAAHARGGAPTLVPGLIAPYYADIPSFLNANRAALGSAAYQDLRLPPTLIGCAATADDLRPALQQANLAFYLSIRARVSARIESDYGHLRAVIYNETQDPVLTGPPHAQPAPPPP